IHDDVGHLDVLARGVIEMIAADGKGVAVAAEYKDMNVGPAQRNAAGEGQGASVNKMHAMRLHEIREAARATDAGHRGDLLVPHFALLDQLEIESEHGE